MRVLNEDYMSLNETELNRAVQKDLFLTDVLSQVKYKKRPAIRPGVG
jgi:hypothetical protein